MTAIAGVKAYYLEDLDKRPLPRPWNAHNLKKFAIDYKCARVWVEYNVVCIK